MVEARSLTKYYGALPALRDASFVARPGQILGYLAAAMRVAMMLPVELAANGSSS